VAPNETAGILLLNKSPGYTSFESLNPVKKALSTGKVGHTGTLDKFASGLLVVLAGWALKLSPWFDRCDKRYRGIISFGVETDTLDGEGRPVAAAAPPGREALERALDQFRGEIMQAPPAYSAIHIGGRRAHELARAGKAPEMQKRPVRIYALELCSYEPPLAEVYVHCSKGAYIRSLARDLALAAGSRGHLVSLERQRVAGFDLADAVPPDAPDLAAALRPITPETFDALGLSWASVEDDAALWLRRGKPPDRIMAAILPASDRGGDDAPESRALFCGAAFVALVERRAGRWSYGYVHARP
jgi:tRNA pseudouridine55 synthase